MDTQALINAALTHYDNVGATDGDNADRRARLLQYAQETFDQVWYFREWPFRHRSGTVTVGDTDVFVNLPADFHEFGVQGGVFRADSARLEERPPSPVFQDQSILGGMSTPQSFSIFGQDSTTGQKQIQLSSPAAGDVVLTVLYLAVAPTLVDTSGSTSNLSFIPAGYHNSVLLPGTVARTKHSEGDSRMWYDMFTQGLARMTVNERPRKTAIQKLPLTVGMW